MISTINGIWWMLFLFVIPLQIASLALMAALGNFIIRALRNDEDDDEA